MRRGSPSRGKGGAYLYPQAHLARSGGYGVLPRQQGAES